MVAEQLVGAVADTCSDQYSFYWAQPSDRPCALAELEEAARTT